MEKRRKLRSTRTRAHTLAGPSRKGSTHLDNAVTPQNLGEEGNCGLLLHKAGEEGNHGAALQKATEVVQDGRGNREAREKSNRGAVLQRRAKKVIAGRSYRSWAK